jgi:hypothetical protein
MLVLNLIFYCFFLFVALFFEFLQPESLIKKLPFVIVHINDYFFFQDVVV